MKKTEIVHFHGLLGTVAKDLIDEGDIADEDLGAYKAVGTSPMAMRGSRDDHKEAALKLAEVLAEALESDIEKPADTDRDADTEADEREAQPTLAA
ncbi:hypothetical protein JCM17823_00280 [Halorubrum gandharaense]